MLEIRRFEEKVEELFLEKKQLVGPSHLYIGQEAVAVGVCSNLTEDDVVVSTYRGHGHAIARGVPGRFIMAELFGRATGTCRGVGGSMHSAKYPELGLMYATAIVGSGIPISAGLALAFKYRKKPALSVAFFGDGAVNTGSFHEGVNLAALWRLPLLLVCENNQYAMGTRVERAVAGGNIANRVSGYGVEATVVDANDVVAVYLSASQAVKEIHGGAGPRLLECLTYRMRGHGVYDKAPYRSPGEVEAWSKKDPISRLRENLLAARCASSADLEAVGREVDKQIDEAVEFAASSPPLAFDELFKILYV